MDQFFKDVEFFMRTQPKYKNISWLDIYMRLSPDMSKAVDEACIEYIKENGVTIEQRHIAPVIIPKNIAHYIANLHFKTK